MEFLASIENSALPSWVRESPSLFAYPFVIALHSVGMAFIVGLNAALDLRLLGFAPRLPIAPMKGLFPLMWAAFGLNFLTGLLLLMQGATRFSVNPLFYIKMGCVAAAIVTLRLLHRKVFLGNSGGLDTTALPGIAKTLAGTSLVFWAGAVIAGRLTAYALFGGVE